MPGPYRDIYNKKETIYGTYQQTARGSAQRGEHDGPRLQIGKGEIDDTLKQGIADCIAARELIKVKVLENSEYSAREAADQLAELTRSEVVQVIGRRFSLYRETSREGVEKIQLD